MSESDRVQSILTRLQAVRERVNAAAARAGRDPSSITLVAVSKTHGQETLRSAIEAGQLVFGENRIEEAGPKMSALSGNQGLEWHMIGHIQSRKAREVIGAGFAMVHSVDTLHLAQRLGYWAMQAKRQQAVLLEFNVSGEASKSGFAAAVPDRWPELLPSLTPVMGVPGLVVQGLMTIAPQVDDPEQARPYFERLRQLGDYLRQHLPAGPGPALSMGMTDDFEAAIQAGATMVRIGRAIFGERD